MDWTFKRGKVYTIFFSMLFLLVFSFFVFAAITISQLSPTDGSKNNSRSINFTFTATWNGQDEDAIGNCAIWTNITGTWAETRVNDSSSTIVNSSALSNINFTLSQDGLFNWAVRCDNGTAGIYYNFSTNRSLMIDTQGPSITLNSPEDLFNLSSTTATFSFTPLDIVSGNVTICAINISSGGTIFESISGLNVTNGVAHQNSSTLALSDGSYQWSVNCSDELGNVETSTARTFTVDTVIPAFYNLSITHTSASVGDVVSLSAVWNDTAMNLHTALLYVNVSGQSDNIVNSTTTVVQNNKVNLSFTLTSSTSAQTLNFSMRVNDSAGNANISTAQLVTVADSSSDSEESSSSSSSGSGGSRSSSGGGGKYVSGFTTGSKTTELNYGDALSFTSKNEKHTVVIVRVRNDSITLRISSKVIEVTLKTGETKKVDIDGNGIDDFGITLTSIVERGGMFTFEILEEAGAASEPAQEGADVADSTSEPFEIPQENEEMSEEEPASEPEEAFPPEKSDSSQWVLLLIALVLIAGVAFYLQKKGQLKKK